MNDNYSERGQGLVQYAFIMLLVAIVVIVILSHGWQPLQQYRAGSLICLALFYSL
jgi:hypothetical protein